MSLKQTAVFWAGLSDVPGRRMSDSPEMDVKQLEEGKVSSEGLENPLRSRNPSWISLCTQGKGSCEAACSWPLLAFSPGSLNLSLLPAHCFAVGFTGSLWFIIAGFSQIWCSFLNSCLSCWDQQQSANVKQCNACCLLFFICNSFNEKHHFPVALKKKHQNTYVCCLFFCLK